MEYRGELVTNICLSKKVDYNQLLDYITTYSKKFGLKIINLNNGECGYDDKHRFCVGLTNSEIEFEIQHKSGKMYINNVLICDHKENVSVEELQDKHDYIKELLNI